MEVESKKAMVWLLPCMVLLFIVDIIPFLVAIGESFRALSFTLLSQRGQWVGLDNYRKALNDPVFLESILTTFKILVPALSIELLLGLGIGLLLAQFQRARRFLMSIIAIPMMIAPVVIGMMGVLALNSEFGPIGIILRNFNLVEKAILGTSLAWIAIVILDIYQWTPLAAIIFLAGILAMPQEPFEAAQIDGASSWQRFLFLTLPMLKNLFAVVLFLRFIDAFKMFDKIWIATEGGPGRTTQTVSIYAFRHGFLRWNLSYGTTLALLIFLVSFIVTYLFVKFSKV
ncbi:sugar ABC transporter permease [Candidatus Aerophobetes bacterium]|nr:sugar ABC transporter permease [Candidatus Aerophobetes bacterium]